MLQQIPPVPRFLGLAGLLPALLCLVIAIAGPGPWQWSALAIAFGYAALIFSFLGGLWWGLAAGAPHAPGWIYYAAIAPSLLALLTYFPWILGWSWPGPSLLLLGLLLLASPLVDQALHRIDIMPSWMLRLRWILSLGLGGATLCLAAVALIVTP